MLSAEGTVEREVNNSNQWVPVMIRTSSAFLGDIMRKSLHLRTHVRISVLSYHIMTSRTVVSSANEWFEISLRLLYAITAQEEEGEWAQDKEEHNCQRNGIC